MNFTGLYDYMQALIGKEITIVFNSGDDIEGTLKDILPDALILSSGSKIAICSTEKIVMICEGSWNA